MCAGKNQSLNFIRTSLTDPIIMTWYWAESYIPREYSQNFCCRK